MSLSNVVECKRFRVSRLVRVSSGKFEICPLRNQSFPSQVGRRSCKNSLQSLCSAALCYLRSDGTYTDAGRFGLSRGSSCIRVTSLLRNDNCTCALLRNFNEAIATSSVEYLASSSSSTSRTSNVLLFSTEEAKTATSPRLTGSPAQSSSSHSFWHQPRTDDVPMFELTKSLLVRQSLDSNWTRLAAVKLVMEDSGTERHRL
ncbi:hypothetical protein GE09DRAFT_459349 [Coniochaeta sp. 2T2.1]|nr:hypothetical protein GE09DRAFT_459349 [Coniochaeta sp. 2T2.1]